ncbi:polynucleotidyl transferase, ribonuclease H-like superfamily protein, partial [Tanacetum coccineum]
VNGSWTAKSRNMCNWCNVATDLKEKFLSFEIWHVKRVYDNEADDQANMAVDLDYGEVQEGANGDGSKFKPLLKWRLKTLSSAHQ